MDEAAKKQALRKINYGVYVVGVCTGDETNAFTCDWLSQCSFSPPLVMMAVRRSSGSNQMIRQGYVFAVSILGKDQKSVAEHFMKPKKRVGDKMGDFDIREGITGAPILSECVAFFECEVKDIFDVGDHSIVVGKVLGAGVNSDEPALRLSETGWYYGG